MIQAMYTFIRKIHRDTKAGILNKPALNLILGLNMILIWIHKLRMGLGNLSDTVQMLVHIGNTVLPYLIDPILCRERIFQYAAISVKSCHLAGLFLHCHLTEKIRDTLFYVCRRILIHILDTIFIEVNPTLLVNIISACFMAEQRCKQTDRYNYTLHRNKGLNPKLVKYNTFIVFLQQKRIRHETADTSGR